MSPPWNRWPDCAPRWPSAGWPIEARVGVDLLGPALAFIPVRDKAADGLDPTVVGGDRTREAAYEVWVPRMSTSLRRELLETRSTRALTLARARGYGRVFVLEHDVPLEVVASMIKLVELAVHEAFDRETVPLGRTHPTRVREVLVQARSAVRSLCRTKVRFGWEVPDPYTPRASPNYKVRWPQVYAVRS